MEHLRCRENGAGIWTWIYYSILHCTILYSILFCSVLFYSVLFCSVLFCSVLFYFILFYLFFSFLYWLYQQALWGQVFFFVINQGLFVQRSCIRAKCCRGFKYLIYFKLSLDLDDGFGFLSGSLVHFPSGLGCLCATGEGCLGSPGKSQDGGATANCAAAGGGKDSNFGLRMVEICFVSKNRGIPKWMVYNGTPYQNGWFGGPTPIFGNTHMLCSLLFFQLSWTCTVVTCQTMVPSTIGLFPHAFHWAMILRGSLKKPKNNKHGTSTMKIHIEDSCEISCEEIERLENSFSRAAAAADKVTWELLQATGFVLFVDSISHKSRASLSPDKHIRLF